MRELTPYGVDNFSVKDVFQVCFEETTNSFAQWFESRILHQILGYNIEKKMLSPLTAVDFVRKYRSHSPYFFPCDKIYTELGLYINRKASEMI